MFAGLARRVLLPACVYAWARSTRTCLRAAYTTTPSANIYPQSEASHRVFASERVALQGRNRKGTTTSCVPSSRNRRHHGIARSTETAATLSPGGPRAAHCGACAKGQVATTSYGHAVLSQNWCTHSIPTEAEAIVQGVRAHLRRPLQGTVLVVEFDNLLDSHLVISFFKLL